MGRRGQEEMVGFVVIVLIVVVIFLVVLGIVIWQKSDVNVKSIDVLQFLESTMQTTTKCALDFEPAYNNIGEILISCYAEPQKECKPSGKKVCLELNETLKEILEISWKVGGNYSLKGYEFEAIYKPRSGGNETEILKLQNGVCLGSYVGEEYILPVKQSRGTIVTKMRVCS